MYEKYEKLEITLQVEARWVIVPHGDDYAESCNIELLLTSLMK